MPEANIKEIVRERYAESARNVRASGSCCGGVSCGADAALAGVSAITGNLYADHEKGALPEEAVLASLGCGNPTALAELREDESDYRMKLAVAGFEAIGVEPTRVYQVDDAREFLSGKGVDVDAIAPAVDGKFMSAFVRAKKPGHGAAKVGGACCAPTCCGT
jgi:hypothetical protein